MSDVSQDALRTYLTNVANSVRTKSGTSDPISASDIPTEISDIPVGVKATSISVNNLPVLPSLLWVGDTLAWKNVSMVFQLENGATSTRFSSALTYGPTGELTANDTKITVEGDWGSQHFVYEKPITVLDPNDWESIVANLPADMNNCPWWIIKRLSQEGILTEHYPIGSSKQVTITNKTTGSSGWGTTTITYFSTTGCDLCLIGYDHNKDLESPNTPHVAHFMLSHRKSTGKTYALYKNTLSSSSQFLMNSTATNEGGWNGSAIKASTFGDDSSVAGQIIWALPEEVRNLMVPVTKWRDNVGGGTSDAENITATEEMVSLLTEYEILGETVNANPHEADKQMQYEFFANRGAFSMYATYSSSDVRHTWTASPAAANTTGFIVMMGGSGSSTVYDANSNTAYPGLLSVIYI